jgi:universal stress protein A
VIVTQARKLKADLIVVGAHSQHGLGLLLGSTAGSVLHSAPCDVLAIHLKN